MTDLIFPVKFSIRTILKAFSSRLATGSLSFSFLSALPSALSRLSRFKNRFVGISLCQVQPAPL